MLHLDFPSDLNSRYDISFCYASTPSSTPWRLIDPLRFPRSPGSPPTSVEIASSRCLGVEGIRPAPGVIQMVRPENVSAAFWERFWNIFRKIFFQAFRQKIWIWTKFFAEFVGLEKKKRIDFCWYLEPENWTIMNSVTVSGWLLHLLSSACGQELLDTRNWNTKNTKRWRVPTSWRWILCNFCLVGGLTNISVELSFGGGNHFLLGVIFHV